MPYNHTTFAQAKQRLANDLGDPGKVFFTDHELGRYIIEALRWWGLTAMYFRETGKVETISNQPFYRIETSLFNQSETELIQGLSVTDRELINDINYALMEPQISSWPGGWVGTEMFSLEDVSSSLSNARDECLKLTACIAQGYTANATTNRVDLPTDHIRILRADIAPNGSGALPLWPIDQVQLHTTVRATVDPGVGRPKAYSVSYSPQLTVDLWPAPEVLSVLEIQGIKAGAALDPVNTATILTIPADASVVLKYRALADLFGGDGLARCPQMEQYCERRYQEGLTTMANYLSLLWSNDGGPRGPISTVAQWDQIRPTWKQTTGTPRSVAMLNWNTLAVRPVPNGIYAMTFEAVRRAPVPTVDGDFIQVGCEHIQSIYDYAQHVALVKSQGQEFEISMSRYESALAAALEYRQQTAAQSPLYQATQLPSLQERWFRPLRKQGPVQAAQADRQAVEA